MLDLVGECEGERACIDLLMVWFEEQPLQECAEWVEWWLWVIDENRSSSVWKQGNWGFVHYVGVTVCVWKNWNCWILGGLKEGDFCAIFNSYVADFSIILVYRKLKKFKINEI